MCSHLHVFISQIAQLEREKQKIQGLVDEVESFYYI